MYDFAICGAGLFGLTFADQCKRAGKTCIIFDSRLHVGGNCYSTRQHGIDVHTYGPHIFNTNSKELWDYANSFAPFNEYRHKVVAVNEGKEYSFPVNRKTVEQICPHWIPNLDLETHRFNQPIPGAFNFEDYGRKKFGPMYDILFHHYTRKQWGREPRNLPASLARRIPVRTDYNDDYHATTYSGVPKDGYDVWTKNMADGHRVVLGSSLTRENWKGLAKRLVWSGSIDDYFLEESLKMGVLEYRTLQFETDWYATTEPVQKTAQYNYTGPELPYTRTVEYIHMGHHSNENPSKSVVVLETPSEWQTSGGIRYYPIPDDKNANLYQCYHELANNEKDVIFGGRLGSYKYLDMSPTIASAIKAFENSQK